MKKALTLLFLLSFVAVMALTGCGSGTTAPEGTNGDDKAAVEETTFERVKRQGYVTVGFANEPPYAYATPDGKLTGQNVEIARAVLKNMGIPEMNGVLTEFGSLIPGLNAKRFDMITAGMYITPERAKQVDFADPEYQIGGALGVRAGNPLNLHSYEDIAANPNVKVAVMAGAQEYDWMLAAGVAESQIVTVPDQPSAFAALQAKRVDAITMTGPSLETLIKNANDPSVERVKDFRISVVNGKKQAAYGSSAFRQEDDDFREAYNAELKKLKESGEVQKIQKQFGYTEAEFAPPDVTAEDALKVW